MRPRSYLPLFLLVAALFTACTGPTNVEDDRAPATTTSPSPSPSVSTSTTSCRGLEIPTDGEVNTVLDRKGGLLEFSYYVARLQRDRSVTIRYRDDPWCRRNRGTLRLIQHVNAGRKLKGCIALPTEVASGETRVELWFFDLFDENTLGRALVVERDIPATEGILAATLRAWIEGPTPEEKRAGARPSAPDGTELLGIATDEGTATVDLSEDFERTNLGSTSEGEILDHLAGMITQFDTIDRGLLKIEGEFKDYYMGHGFLVNERDPLVRPSRGQYRVAPTC